MATTRIFLQRPRLVNRRALPPWQRWRSTVLLWACVAARAVAEPQVNISEHYYPVAVESVAQMREALDEASPLREGASLYHGYTDSNVRWNWWWRRRDGQCRIERVESVVDIQYTLPRLNTAAGNFQVRSLWSSWFWALKAHEENHGEHAVEIARRGETEILAVAPHPDCAVVDRRASELAADLIGALKALDADYDRRTQHGRTDAQRIFDNG